MSARAIAVEGLSVDLGGFSLSGLDLAVAEGETLVLLGPNGAGKSLTLETIAGFHRPRAGRIVIGGREVTRLPPERRNVALVLQNFGLFPHLSVRGNIAFGLRRNRDRGRLVRLLDEFAIAPLAERDPAQLSPGEKQRVALARALAAEPDLFLFDEPFSALDAQTRERLREELALFLNGSGIPAIFVTHDRADAFAFGGKLAVMRAGKIVEKGAAPEVFRAPQSRFVAEFLGVENLVEAQIAGSTADGLVVAIGNALLVAAAPPRLNGAAQECLVAIRAEDVEIAPSDSAPNRLSARIVAVGETAALTRVALDCGFPLIAWIMSRDARRLKLLPNSVVHVAVAPEAIHLVSRSPRDRGQ